MPWLVRYISEAAKERFMFEAEKFDTLKFEETVPEFGSKYVWHCWKIITMLIFGYQSRVAPYFWSKTPKNGKMYQANILKIWEERKRKKTKGPLQLGQRACSASGDEGSQMKKKIVWKNNAIKHFVILKVNGLFRRTSAISKSHFCIACEPRQDNYW